LNATGVAGTVTATLANGASGAVFTGPASTASFVTGNGLGEIITTGTANDAIYVATGTTGSANLTGGLGNDTYSFDHTTVNSSQITDTSGTDTLVMLNATSTNITGLNSGASLVASGIEQVVVASTKVMSIVTGQVTGAVAFNGGAGAALAITQTTVGTTADPAITNLSSATAATFNYLSATGATTAGIAITGVTIVGGTGVDTITAFPGITNKITPGTGVDSITLGTGTDSVFQAASSSGVFAATGGANSISTATFDVIRGAAVGDIINIGNSGTVVTTLVTANTVATVTLTDQSVTVIRGNLTGSTFVGASDGTDSLIAYDTDAAGTTVFNGVVVVGLITGTLSNAGVLTLA
jgi:hypothetical protein